MKSILKKTQDWYNPMSINEKQFDLINIVDGEKILFSFNWFLKFERSSNSTDQEIELSSKLVRSTLIKNKLRYTRIKENQVLSIDKSLLSYTLIKSEIESYDYNDTKIETYKLDNFDAFFTVRTQQKPNAKQVAYNKLSELLENENRQVSMYEVKRILNFYNKNKALFKKAGVK